MEYSCGTEQYMSHSQHLVLTQACPPVMQSRDILVPGGRRRGVRILGSSIGTSRGLRGPPHLALPHHRWCVLLLASYLTGFSQWTVCVYVCL